MSTTVKPKQNYSTTDYGQFSFLMENRQTGRSHINRLKDAIQRNPEILEVQPILVNEKLEIIDGQHRFVAASELGVPVHYTVVKGIGIDTARDMNVMQRKWGIEDYAYSYAKAGNVHYKAFNTYIRENPGISKTIVMVVLGGGEGENMSSNFKAGKFIIKREQEDAEWVFKQLNLIREITSGEIPLSKSFVSALAQCLNKEEFDFEEFMLNLRRKPDAFHRVSTVRDALRMIEDIYNFKKSINTIRLY
jgi:ParB-like nuclease domain.